MFKISIMSISFLFASLFGFFGGGKLDPFEESEALMNSIIDTSIKQLSHRYGVYQVGIGGSEKDEKHKTVFVGFKIFQKLTKEEARILIVEIVGLFLSNINNNKEIKQFLYDNPFTYKNLEFTVLMFNCDGTDLYHPDVGLVSLTRRGTVSYVTYEPGTRCGYASDVEEPYEEAYKIATQR